MLYCFDWISVPLVYTQVNLEIIIFAISYIYLLLAVNATLRTSYFGSHKDAEFIDSKRTNGQLCYRYLCPYYCYK